MARTARLVFTIYPGFRLVRSSDLFVEYAVRSYFAGIPRYLPPKFLCALADRGSARVHPIWGIAFQLSGGQCQQNVPAGGCF